MKMKLKSLKRAPRKKGLELPFERAKFEEQIAEHIMRKQHQKYKVKVLNYDIKKNQITIDTQGLLLPFRGTSSGAGGTPELTILGRGGSEAILVLQNKGLKGVFDDDGKTFKLNSSLYNDDDKELIEKYIDIQKKLQAKNGAKSYLNMKVYPTVLEAENDKILLEEMIELSDVVLPLPIRATSEKAAENLQENPDDLPDFLELVGKKFYLRKIEGTPEVFIKTVVLHDVNIELRKTVLGEVILNISELEGLRGLVSNGIGFFKTVIDGTEEAREVRGTTCFEIGNDKNITFNRVKKIVASYKPSDEKIFGISVTDKDNKSIVFGKVINKMNDKNNNQIELKLEEKVKLAVDGFEAEKCNVELMWFMRSG